MPALPKPEERRVRPSVAVDPNDINAQLALEVLDISFSLLENTT